MLAALGGEGGIDLGWVILVFCKANEVKMAEVDRNSFAKGLGKVLYAVVPFPARQRKVYYAKFNPDVSMGSEMMHVQHSAGRRLKKGCHQ